MPKTSAIERNKKRQRLVEKYKAKRAELKAILANPKTADADFFAAQKKMARLPRNSSRVRIRNRCSLSGRPRATSGASAFPASPSANSRLPARFPA